MSETGAARRQKTIEEAIVTFTALGIGAIGNILETPPAQSTAKAELEKQTRHLPARVKSEVLQKVELNVDRIDDLKSEDNEQKITTILYFGEQGDPEHIPILEETKKENEDAKIKYARIKAIRRIDERYGLFLRLPFFSEAEEKGNFEPDRRPWRAMVRVTGLEKENLRVVLPGWDSGQEIQINKDRLPKELRRDLRVDRRFFAEVNIGAENESELYFKAFEYTPKDEREKIIYT